MKTTFPLDFTALNNALEQLAESLLYVDSDLAKDPKLFKQFRAATIQAFEYSYELSCKSLKRFLQFHTSSTDVIDAMTFSEMIRTGYEQGLLLHSWPTWRVYRDARNSTSHAYAEKVADEVLEKIPAFLHEAQYLYHKLIEKNHD